MVLYKDIPDWLGYNTVVDPVKKSYPYHNHRIMLVSKMHFPNISTINLTKLFFPMNQLLGNFITGAGSLLSCLTGRAPFYPPQLLLRKGNVCTSVCQELCPQDGGGGGLYPSMHWIRHTPTPGQTPPGRHPPLPSACWDTDLPTQCMLGYTPPPGSHCSGRYASYWNAFLSSKCHWWIQRGGCQGRSPGVQILLFSCSFRQKNWLAHSFWELAPTPPKENPRSTKGLVDPEFSRWVHNPWL